MHEPRRPLALDQALGHQRGDRLGARVAVQPGQPPGPPGGGRAAQHGDSAGRSQRGRGHPPQLQQHPARHRLRGQPPQVRHLGVGSRQALGGQSVQQSPQQQRVPPGQFPAGLLERRRHRRAQHRAHQLRARGGAQRGQPQHGHGRLRSQPRDQGLVLRGPRPGLADGQDQQDRQALQPGRQMSHEPLRRLIGPVQVIDRQQQRRVLRDVGGQPVQAVQDRERVLLPPARAAGHRQAGQRHRIARQPRPAAGPDPGLEQLPDHPPRVPVLELRAPRRQHRHARFRRPVARIPEQGGLADPRRALHQQHRPRPRARRLHRRRYRTQFRRPVQQQARRPAPRPHASDRRPAPAAAHHGTGRKKLWYPP